MQLIAGVLMVGCSPAAVPAKSCPPAPSSTAPAASTTATGSAIKAPAQRQTLVVKPYQSHGHRSVRVKVAGEELPFLFDTGGGVTLLTPELAKAAGCTPFGSLVGFRMRGEQVAFPRCDAVGLQIGDFALKPSPAGVFDLNKLIPPDWPRLGGMVTLSSFEEKLVTLDLGKGQVHIDEPPAAGAQGSPLRIVRQASGYSIVVLAPVKTRAGTLWLELDTGSDAPLMLAPHAAKALGVDLKAEGVTHKEPPAGAKGGRELWRVPSVNMELPGVGAVTTSATVTDIIYDGNIGAPLLEKFRWKLDLKNKRVSIESP